MLPFLVFRETVWTCTTHDEERFPVHYASRRGIFLAGHSFGYAVVTWSVYFRRLLLPFLMQRAMLGLGMGLEVAWVS